MPFGELASPTCQQLKESAGQFPLGANCDVIRNHQSFCGCPQVGEVLTDVCSLCDGGLAPRRPEKVTIFGETCEAVDAYLSSLPPEECGTQRVGFIGLVDFFCDCPGVSLNCSVVMNGQIYVCFSSDKVMDAIRFLDPRPSCLVPCAATKVATSATAILCFQYGQTFCPVNRQHAVI